MRVAFTRRPWVLPAPVTMRGPERAGRLRGFARRHRDQALALFMSPGRCGRLVASLLTCRGDILTCYVVFTANPAMECFP